MLIYFSIVKHFELTEFRAIYLLIIVIITGDFSCIKIGKMNVLSHDGIALSC